MKKKKLEPDGEALVYGKDTLPLYRFYMIEMRSGRDRRQNDGNAEYAGPERRAGKERRQDADWRFALIRRQNRPPVVES